MKKYKELHNPIIFIGTGRSGTTIISEIIMKHPDLAYPSNYQEMFYKQPMVNLVRLLFDNKMWQIYGQKKQLNKIDILNWFYFRPGENYAMWNYLTDLDFSRGFLVDKLITNERIRFIRNYFCKMVKFQKRKRLVLKITGPPRITFLSQIFPDASIINLKRKSIPTINSFLNIDFWKTRGINKLWWIGVYSENEKEWAKNNSENAALLTAFQLKKIADITKIEINNLQPKYMEVNYENFIVNPEREIDRIADFIDLKHFNFTKYLESINIYNRNKDDDEYFSKCDLKDIFKILHSE